MKQILHDEEARYPDASSAPPLKAECGGRRTERKDSELASADHVVVPARFVRDGLLAAGILPTKVTVIPFGCEAGRSYRTWSERKPVVLCVGHLSLRKGTPHLLDVWKRLGAYRSHDLLLVGKSMLTPAFLAQYKGTFKHIPHLPRSELWDHYSSARVFVFPSACDGLGLVLNESLSSGTPVIASDRSGAPGFIQHGVQGLIYRHGDDDQLATHLDWMLSHPREAAEMSRAAYAFAQSWGWSQYRAAFLDLVKSRLTAAQAS